MAKRKSTKKTKSKKALEAKIAQLESKLSQLSTQIAQKPAGQAQKAPPPPPPPKPAEAPKPAKAQAAPPATRDSLIEAIPVGIWHDRKTKTPGYVSENSRAWARRHAEGADAPTHPWALQKSKIPGYTAPSNKYFATRQRLSYHPQATSFTGYGISLGHGASQAQAQAPPPPPPPPQDSALPKESGSGGGSSRKQTLEQYEQEYLARLENQQKEDLELQRAAEELAAKRRGQSGSASSGGSTHGSLPKGF